MTSEQPNKNARTNAGRKLLPLGEHAEVRSGRWGVTAMGETAALGWLVVDCCQCTRAIACADAAVYPRKIARRAAKIRLTCPQCGYSAEYTASEVRICQGQLALAAR